MSSKMPCRIALVALIVLLLCPLEAHAFLLPECHILPEERSRPAEDNLAGYFSQMERLAPPVSLKRLEQHRRDPKTRLSRKEIRLVQTFNRLNATIDFWNYIVNLRGALIGIHGGSLDPKLMDEADRIAKGVIGVIYDLSQKWRVGSSTLFHNFLINIGAREKGFCYHYVDELMSVVTSEPLGHFDIHWGTAWEGDFRENNALVITAKGAPFEKGLAIDAWRRAGRPFWTRVKGDRFPWVELGSGLQCCN